MSNSTGFWGSQRGCPAKKRGKSRAACHRVDKAIEIRSLLSGDLFMARFPEAKARGASGRFNGEGAAERASSAVPICPRAYSGLQPARHLGLEEAGKVQIGSQEQPFAARKAICPPMAKADLKPLSADSYLSYLDTI